MAQVKEITIEPDQDVIEYLEGLLIEAKAGDLQSFACVRYYSDNSTTNGWIGLGKNTRLMMAELLIMSQLLTDYYVQAQLADIEEAND